MHRTAGASRLGKDPGWEETLAPGATRLTLPDLYRPAAHGVAAELSRVAPVIATGRQQEKA